MSKIKTYGFLDFAKTQEGAIQRFLHHAHDHMIASRMLRDNPIFLDSSAYLCNMAFELFLKAVHIAENGKFKGLHNLISLHDGLDNKMIAKRDLPLVKVIDKYSLVRYPIDKALNKSQKKLRLGGRTFGIDEIGTDELEKADELFVKLWRKLHRLNLYKAIINNIHDRPYQKGNRILMQKNRNGNQQA